MGNIEQGKPPMVNQECEFICECDNVRLVIWGPGGFLSGYSKHADFELANGTSHTEKAFNRNIQIFIDGEGVADLKDVVSNYHEVIIKSGEVVKKRVGECEFICECDNVRLVIWGPGGFLSGYSKHADFELANGTSHTEKETPRNIQIFIDGEGVADLKDVVDNYREVIIKSGEVVKKRVQEKPLGFLGIFQCDTIYDGIDGIE